MKKDWGKDAERRLFSNFIVNSKILRLWQWPCLIIVLQRRPRAYSGDHCLSDF